MIDNINVEINEGGAIVMQFSFCDFKCRVYIEIDNSRCKKMGRYFQMSVGILKHI